jgi:predicted outer membrane repeat protein
MAFLLSVPLLHMASSACAPNSFYSGLATRITFSRSGTCAEVKDSLFQNLSASNGGAIYFDSGIGSSTVLSTTFFHTTASFMLVFGTGGGICFRGENLTIAYCCFRETTAHEAGTAVRFSNAQGLKFLVSTSFLGCYGDEQDTDGTISDDEGPPSSYLRLNFTECHMTISEHGGDGYCVCTIHDSGFGAAEFAFCTALNCVGSSGIYSHFERTLTVSYCNFFGNVQTSGTIQFSVLFASVFGMDVRYCIFSNTGIPMALEANEYIGFLVSYCVFSDAVPSGDFIQASAGNKGWMNMAPFGPVIYHANIDPCPIHFAERVGDAHRVFRPK